MNDKMISKWGFFPLFPEVLTFQNLLNQSGVLSKRGSLESCSKKARRAHLGPVHLTLKLGGGLFNDSPRVFLA